MLWRFFQKITDQADDFYHTSQVEEFFAWLHADTLPKKRELIFLNLPLQQELIDSQTKKKVSYESKILVAFVLCESGQLDYSLKILNHAVTKKSWHLVFYASGIEIWESVLRHGEVLPIRFGIREEEKKRILNFARKCMEGFFKNTTVEKDEQDTTDVLKGEETANMDVALWINGDLRGSIIIENRSLYEGVRHASLSALRDKRMKPVELHELVDAQIEITIFSDLRLPLRKKDINNLNIDGRKGYYVIYEGKYGWYLPAVFNCVKFKRMVHLRESLILEKAKISQESIDGVSLYAYMVEGFMEGGGGEVLLLDGAVAYKEIDVKNSPPLFIEEVRARGDLAAEWLLSMQDEDGFMPLYADAIHSSFGRMDWVRLACTVHALACYGEVTDSEKFLKGARRTLNYLAHHLLGITNFSANESIAALVYLARTAMVMNENIMLRDIMLQIMLHRQSLNYEPILMANMATLFALQASDNPSLLREGKAFAGQVFDDFQTKLNEKKHIQLAQYPELAHALELLYRLTGEDIYAKKVTQVKEWLLAQQFGNGAFPSDTHSSFIYSRGTGKIFEMLAATPELHTKALEKSFKWLARMQYGEDNAYFVAPAFRSRIHGGLRHDHANSEAWIDSAGHFLLGIARIISGMHDPEMMCGDKGLAC